MSSSLTLCHALISRFPSLSIGFTTVFLSSNLGVFQFVPKLVLLCLSWAIAGGKGWELCRHKLPDGGGIVTTAIAIPVLVVVSFGLTRAIAAGALSSMAILCLLGWGK